MFNVKQVEGATSSQLEWTEWYYVRSALAPFTVIANLTVVISSGVILKSNVQPRTLYMFMGNLALADLLHGAMTIVELILRHYFQETFFYVIQLGLNLSSILASCMGVSVIAIDRYIFLKHSIHYTLWMTKVIAQRIIIGVWVYSFTVCFIFELMFSQPMSEYNDNRFIKITPMYLLDMIACSLFLPILVTIVLYTSVLVTVFKIRRKEARKGSTVSNSVPTAKNTNQINDISVYSLENNFNTSNIKSETVSELNNIISFTNSIQTQLSQKAEEEERTNCCCKFNQISKCRLCGSVVTISLHGYRDINIHHKTTSTDIHQTNKILTKPLQKRLNIRSFVMVFLIMFVFTISWGPYCLSLIIYSILCRNTKPADNDGSVCSQLQIALNTFLLSLGFLNALMNPFLYCWWHKGFRASLHKICCKNNAREKKRNDYFNSLNNKS